MEVDVKISLVYQAETEGLDIAKGTSPFKKIAKIDQKGERAQRGRRKK